MNKRSGLTLIILWSSVLALVVALFVALAMNSGFHWSIGFHLPGDRSSFVTVKEDAFTADEVEDLSVNWTSGRLTLAVGGDTIRVVQKANEGLPEKQMVRIENRGGVLTVSDGRGGFRLFSFGANSTDLEITLPEKTFRAVTATSASADILTGSLNTGMLKLKSTSGEITVGGHAESADISSTSGDLLFDGLQVANRLNVSTTSGEIRGGGASSQDLRASSVSGDIVLSGSYAGEISLSSTSGEISFDSSEAPASIQSSSVSGDIVLRVPENSGFTMDYHSVSGRFSSDFAATDNGSSHRYGDGSRPYQANTTSGSIRLQQH